MRLRNADKEHGIGILPIPCSLSAFHVPGLATRIRAGTERIIRGIGPTADGTRRRWRSSSAEQVVENPDPIREAQDGIIIHVGGIGAVRCGPHGEQIPEEADGIVERDAADAAKVAAPELRGP